MTTYMNLDYNNFASTNSTIGNISPSLSSEDSNNFDSSYAYNSMSNQMYSVSADPMSPNSEFSKLDIRRIKNRQSAARSRQKIKNKLSTLEKSCCQLEDRKDALINEKYLIMHEIESLENKMLNMSMNKINNDGLNISADNLEIKHEFVQY